MKKTAILFISVLMLSCPAQEGNITPAEKELLITLDDIAGVYGFDFMETENCEKYTLRRNFDGSREIEYDYDYSGNTANIWPLCIHSEMEFNDSPEAALESFEGYKTAYNLGFTLSGSDGEFVEDPDLVDMGDAVYSGHIVLDGTEVGSLVLICSGDKIISLMITGWPLTDREKLGELLSPVLGEPVRNRL